jgi:hypothetical protein
LARHPQIDADPDPAYHFDADPYLDPDPTFHFDADPELVPSVPYLNNSILIWI